MQHSYKLRVSKLLDIQKRLCGGPPSQDDRCCFLNPCGRGGECASDLSKTFSNYQLWLKEEMQLAVQAGFNKKRQSSKGRLPYTIKSLRSSANRRALTKSKTTLSQAKCPTRAAIEDELQKGSVQSLCETLQTHLPKEFYGFYAELLNTQHGFQLAQSLLDCPATPGDFSNAPAN